jgi:cobalt/nickel transport system permease protein
MSTTQEHAPVSDARARTPKGLLLGGLLLAFLLAGFVSGYASGSPDGLEKVAGDEGFLDSSQDSAASGSPLADYALKGIENERLAGGLAGFLGVLLTIAVGTLIFFVVSRLARGRSGRSEA